MSFTENRLVNEPTETQASKKMSKTLWRTNPIWPFNKCFSSVKLILWCFFPDEWMSLDGNVEKTKAIKCHENKITVSSTRSLEIYHFCLSEKNRNRFYGFSGINGRCSGISLAKRKGKEVEENQTQWKSGCERRKWPRIVSKYLAEWTKMLELWFIIATSVAKT